MQAITVIVTNKGKVATVDLICSDNQSGLIGRGVHANKNIGQRAEEVFLSRCKKFGAPEISEDVDNNAPNLDDGYWQSEDGIVVSIVHPLLDR